MTTTFHIIRRKSDGYYLNNGHFLPETRVHMVIPLEYQFEDERGLMHKVEAAWRQHCRRRGPVTPRSDWAVVTVKAVYTLTAKPAHKSVYEPVYEGQHSPRS